MKTNFAPFTSFEDWVTLAEAPLAKQIQIIHSAVGIQCGLGPNHLDLLIHLALARGEPLEIMTGLSGAVFVSILSAFDCRVVRRADAQGYGLELFHGEQPCDPPIRFYVARDSSEGAPEDLLPTAWKALKAVFPQVLEWQHTVLRPQLSHQ
ncbi:MAG: hypothetical protein PHQ12_03485 [Chthoniobacteraceae bacterium]|nr:hypothetical protein [Chthoniobacteraceae bacterium]